MPGGAARAVAASPELAQLKAWQESTATPLVPKTPQAVRRKVFGPPSSSSSSRTSTKNGRSRGSSRGHLAHRSLRRISNNDARESSADQDPEGRLHDERPDSDSVVAREMCEVRTRSFRVQGAGAKEAHARTEILRANVAQLHALQTKVTKLEGAAGDAHARVSGTVEELQRVRRELEHAFAELRETPAHAKQRKARLMLEAELLNARQSILVQRTAVARKEGRVADMQLLDACKELRRLACKQEALRGASETERHSKARAEKLAPGDFLRARDAQLHKTAEAQRQRTLRALFHKLQVKGPRVPGPKSSLDASKPSRKFANKASSSASAARKGIGHQAAHAALRPEACT